jgi:hypothetical protein
MTDEPYRNSNSFAIRTDGTRIRPTLWSVIQDYALACLLATELCFSGKYSGDKNVAAHMYINPAIVSLSVKGEKSGFVQHVRPTHTLRPYGKCSR